MVRVLHVVESAKGGVPLFVRRVCEGLRQGFEFEIACPPLSELYLRPPTNAVVHPVGMARQFHPLRDPASARRIRRLLQSNPYDIVHLNSSKAGILGLLLGDGFPAKTVFTPHALRSNAYADGSVLRRVALFIEARICRAVDLIVAVSQEEQRQVIESGMAPPDRVRLIENGVDLSGLSTPPALTRADVGLPPEAFVVGTVGRLSPQKDPITFVRAAVSMAGQVPRAHFVLVGDGPLEADVRRLIVGRGLSHQFHLLGWRSDATEVLKLLDVFVLTSHYEGMPFVLLEAAGARRPIVCTAAPGVRSLIQDESSGLVTEIGDWRGLATAVRRLYERPDERSRLAEAAFQTVALPRGLDVMVEGWGTLYRTVAEEAASLAAARPRRLLVAGR